MPIEAGEGGTSITGDEVNLFRYLQVMHGLALEINTGMKLSSRGSVMQVGQRICGSTKRTKKGVLRDMVAYAREQFPAWEPSASVVKALVK